MDGQFEQWLVGFWEGDGTVGDYGRGHIRFTFTQKYRQVLDFIRERIGTGLMYENGGAFRLFVNRREHVERLFDIFTRCLVTRERADQLCRFFPVDKLDLHDPTKHWFTGFYDAEGSSACRVNNLGYAFLRLLMAQRDRAVLDQLRKLWCVGGVYAHNARTTTPEGRTYDVTQCLWEVNGSKTDEIVAWLIRTSHNNQKLSKLREDINKVSEARAEKRLVRQYLKENPETEQRMVKYLQEHPEITLTGV